MTIYIVIQQNILNEKIIFLWFKERKTMFKSMLIIVGKQIISYIKRVNNNKHIK